MIQKPGTPQNRDARDGSSRYEVIKKIICNCVFKGQMAVQDQVRFSTLVREERLRCLETLFCAQVEANFALNLHQIEQTAAAVAVVNQYHSCMLEKYRLHALHERVNLSGRVINVVHEAEVV